MRYIGLTSTFALGPLLWGVAARAATPDLATVAWPAAHVDAKELAPSRLQGELAARAAIVRSFLAGALAALPTASASEDLVAVPGAPIELRPGQLAAWGAALLAHGVVASPADAARVATALCPQAVGGAASGASEVRAACWVDLVVWAQDALVEGGGTAEQAQAAPSQRQDWTDREKAERKQLARQHEGRAVHDVAQALLAPVDFAAVSHGWLQQLGPGDWPMYLALQAELVRYRVLAAAPMPPMDRKFPIVGRLADADPQALALSLSGFTAIHRKILRDRLCFQGYCPTTLAMARLARVRAWSLPADIATAAQAAKSWKRLQPQAPMYDLALFVAVRNFQSDHGLRVTGWVDAATRTALRVPMQDRVEQLRLSLQRIRDTTLPAADAFLVVNVPAFRVDVWRGGAVERSHAAQVGIAFETKHGKRTPRRQTPMLTATMTALTIDPAWFVPGSILSDVFDEFRRDSKYRKRNHFEFRPLAGSHSKALVMAAGPQNALGEVKFEFPNPHLVFMHDTPSKWRFSLPERMTSHGCIRVQDAAVLARSLLTHDQDVEWTEAKWKQARKNRDEIHIALHKPLPIHLMYLTADAAPDGHVRFFRDFYRLDRRDRGLVQAWRTRQVPSAAPIVTGCVRKGARTGENAFSRVGCPG